MPNNDQGHEPGDGTLHTLFQQMAHHQSLDTIHLDRDHLSQDLSQSTASRPRKASGVVWWTAVGVTFSAVVAFSLTNGHFGTGLAGRGLQPTSPKAQADQKMADALRHGRPLLWKVGPFRVLAFQSPAGPHPTETLRAWYQGQPGPGTELSVTWGPYGFFSGSTSLQQLSAGATSTFGGLSFQDLPGPSVPVRAKWRDRPNGHTHVSTVPLRDALVLQVSQSLHLTGSQQGWAVSYQRTVFTGHGVHQPTGELTITHQGGIPKRLNYDLVLAHGLQNMKQGVFGQNTRTMAWQENRLAWTGTPRNPRLILTWPGHHLSVPLHTTS